MDIDTTLAEGAGRRARAWSSPRRASSSPTTTPLENASTIDVQIDGQGHTYSGTVLGYSINDDVGVGATEDASGLKTVTTGNSSDLSVGATVIGIGNAGGVGGTPSTGGG